MAYPSSHDDVWDRFRYFVTYINEIEKAGLVFMEVPRWIVWGLGWRAGLAC